MRRNTTWRRGDTIEESGHYRGEGGLYRGEGDTRVEDDTVGEGEIL